MEINTPLHFSKSKELKHIVPPYVGIIKFLQVSELSRVKCLHFVKMKRDLYLIKMKTRLLLLLLWNPLDLIGSSTAEVSANEKSIRSNLSNITINIDIAMPASVRSSEKTEERYFCTVRKLNLPEDDLYIKEFNYENLDMKNNNIHHFLLYGCKTVSKYFLENDYWPCHLTGKGNPCDGRKQIPLGLPSNRSDFKTAKRTEYPPLVAYGIGRKFNINFLMLELHVVNVREKSARNNLNSSLSGVQMSLTNIRPKYYAGMMTMAGVGFRIPPGREKFSIDINCQPRISSSIHPYAYWVHTHELGKVVSGYKLDKRTGLITEIARWSHHFPQPVILDLNATGNSNMSLFPGDFFAAKCTYNSSAAKTFTNWGRRRFEDEMCNLFIFFYTESPNPDDISLSCVNELSRKISNKLPANSDTLIDIPSPPHTIFIKDDTTEKSRSSTNVNKSLICNLYRKFGIKNCPYE